MGRVKYKNRLQKEVRYSTIADMQLTNAEKFTLRQKISDYAKEIGFDLVGFSPAKIEEKYLVAFEDWLGNEREGSMEYMKKIEQRRDLTKILPGAKSVIVFGMNYFNKQPALKRGHGRVARYAFGRDYHKVIGKKLKMVEKFIGEMCADFEHERSPVEFSSSTPPSQICVPNVHTKSRGDISHQELANKTASTSVREDSPRGGQSHTNAITKSYVDTGPILERALAEQAGLGRIGKNSLLITEKFGSWIFLSEIITTLDLNFANDERTAETASSRWSSPAEKSFNVCGNCNKCMTACPTGAIIAPGVVDARLCISYLTIENKEKIPPALAKIIKKTKRLYGCDVCQEVCPHNDARAKIATAPQDGLFTPIAGDSLDIKKILTKTCTSEETFLKTFAGSPVMRAKRKGLQRTAKIFN